MKLLVAVFFYLSLIVQADENWPQYRGPLGDGSSNSKNLPTEWSEDKNVAWKTAIHGRAWSSPVIYGKQVWLTTATEDGKELSVLCVDKGSGRILLDQKLFDIEEPQFAHKFNSYASPSPVIEQGRVYISFGSPGTACLDTKSFKVLWTREDIICNHFRGSGSSPILFEELLIMNFDGSDQQFVMALDKSTGQTRWRTERSVDFMDLNDDGEPEREGDWRKAFGTPHIAKIDGRLILVSQGAKAVYGYEPRTGKELWRFDEHTNHSAGSRPLVAGDTVYATTGFPRPFLLALDGSGKGILDESAVLWKTQKGVPKKPSLQLVGNLLFGLSDIGHGTCWDALSGEARWSERIPGGYSASPILANGKIYFFNEAGTSTVIEASTDFKILAENVLDEGCMGSPAVSGDELFIRTKTHLYCIRN